MSANREVFFHLVRNPWKFRLYLLMKLPAAFFSGLRVEEITREKCSVSVPYKWLTKNPFSSTYFASLSMAAEMTTGLPGMANIYRHSPSVSMLLTALDARYHKKATGRTLFTCDNGLLIADTIRKAIETGEGCTVVAHAKGHSLVGELVAEFNFTWSFKVKKRRSQS